MSQIRTILSFCVAAFPASISFADEDVIPDEEIHIVGSRIERLELKLPADRIVIDSESVDSLATTDILDLMRGLPGIDGFRQGGTGSRAFLSVRGGDPNFTVIMLNGVRLNDPTDSRGGGFDMALLEPGAIEKIEIIKGAQGTAYGADALSGVINIITHQPRDRPEWTLYSGGDTNQGLQVGARLQGPLSDRVSGAMSAGYSDGGTALVGDRRQRLNLNGQLVVRFSDIADIHLSSFLADGSATAFPEDSGGARLAALRQVEERNDRLTAISAEFAFFAIGRWQPALTLQWSQNLNRSDHPGIAPGNLQGIPASVTDTQFRQLEIIANNRLAFSDSLTISFGGAYRTENGLSESVIDFGLPVAANFALQRTTKSAFGQGDLRLADRFNLGFGLRFDRLKEVGDRVTTRLSASYVHVPSGAEVEISWGQGFKLPSFFALGHPIVGNSELDPEEASNLSVTIRKASPDERIELVVSAFRNQFRNLIDFDPVLFRTVNRLRVRARGIEIGIVGRPAKALELAAGVTYQQVDVPGGEINLRFRPAWKGNFRGSWQLTADLSISLSGFAIGRYFDSSVPTGPVFRSGFSRFDAGIDWALNEHIKVSLSAFNLLDSSYEEAVGFPSLPRTARLKLTARR